VDDLPPDTPVRDFAHDLRIHGFEPGWGATAGRVAENLSLLARILDAPEPGQIERLLGRLPLITSVLMVSPHGWFAQEGVLGKPDTGGQVTYVLDQARALEQQMRRLLAESGVDTTPKVLILTRLIPNAEDTTCNVPRERILGTENGWIVRAPFRHPNGDIVQDWISRFHIWPYLEQFSEESTQLVVTELLGKPDLIIGHYTDGNLVAHRLGEELGVTHCACVHALEKTKYLLSDMHWTGMENDYHFSLQFTADLIAYNAADYILSSSYREVGGTATEMGMIESYDLFSMPGLYRVESGLNPRLARHNIVPPGASEEHFFPNAAHERRVEAVTQRIRERFLGGDAPPNCVGRLKNPNLPFVFSMARLDKIKNLSGLVEVFAKDPSLRQRSNLLLMTSVNDPAQSKDQEEIEEAKRIYSLLEEHNLDGHVRWCAARLDKGETGEIYRVVADGKGVFAQPAFLETFGLTVIEAMACGLPVVVTCFGGPSEIVESGRSGLVENPNDHAAFARALRAVVGDDDTWRRLAEGGIHRVSEKFTWGGHANKVLRMANVHAYCNHVEVMNREALDRYIHTLYHTVYRPRAQAMLQ
jgi:sucrose synthase